MTSSFDPKKCLIPTVWCGKGPVPKNNKDYDKNIKYTREGSKDECVQKGFGAGTYAERSKTLPEKSLQKIKYVGATYEKNFQDRDIEDLDDLVRFARGSPTKSIKSLILEVTTKKDKKIDHRAYNHIMVWLYNNGVDASKIPKCFRLVSLE